MGGSLFEIVAIDKAQDSGVCDARMVEGFWLKRLEMGNEEVVDNIDFLDLVLECLECPAFTPFRQAHNIGALG